MSIPKIMTASPFSPQTPRSLRPYFTKSRIFLSSFPAYFAVPFRKKIAASAPGVVYWVQTVLFFQTIHLKFTAFSNSCIKIKSYTEL